MKKWIVLCFILLLSLVLYACGEPELDISDSTGKGYYLNQTGKTSDNAKITLKDENGDSKKSRQIIIVLLCFFLGLIRRQLIPY